MEKKEIIEGNKLIADFMGVIPKPVDGVYVYSDMPWFSMHEKDKEKAMKYFFEYVKYHSSWGWLMPVIEKIEEMPLCSVCIKSNGTRIRVYNFETLDDVIFQAYPKRNSSDKTKISVTYSAVVRFIEWYNESLSKSEE